MREPHQILRLKGFLLCCCLSFFYSLDLMASCPPLENNPIDTTQAKEYLKKARTAYREGKYNDARRELDTLVKYIDTLYAKDDLQRGEVLLFAGKVRFKQSYYDEALWYYDEANKIFFQDSTKYLKQIGKSLGDMGAVHLQKGNFDKANGLFIQAAELKKATVGENSISLAYTYYNIGAGFASQGDFQAALDYFFKSVGIIRKIKGEEHRDVAYVYNGIGTVYLRQGEWEQANDYFQKIMKIRVATQTEKHPDAARDYDRIGQVYQNNGQLDSAKIAYQKALKIRQETLPANHTAFIESYWNLAAIHLINDELEESEALLKKCLPIHTNTKATAHPSFTQTYFQLASIARARKDYDTAINYCQTALVNLVPDFESMALADNPEVDAYFPNKTKLSDLLHRKGLFLYEKYLQTKDKEAILLAYSASLESNKIGDLVRNEFGSGYSKQAWLSESHGIYNRLVANAAIIANFPDASITEDTLFTLIEKSKAILLLESLKVEAAEDFSEVPTNYLNKEKLLEKQIAFFDGRLASRKQRNVPPTDSKLMELESKVFTLRQDYNQLIEEMETRFPKYHQLKYDTRLASIGQIQQQLAHDSIALLNYSVTPKQLFVMAITKEGVYQHNKVIDSSFFKQINALKIYLNTSPSTVIKTKEAVNREQYIQNAHQLYQIILAPILAQMQQINELIVIPDNKLNYLPFETLLINLPNPQNQAFDQLDYALNKYSIHYEYSATLWLQNQKEKAQRGQLFAGFAPEYQGTALLASRTTRALDLSENETQFSPLKFNQSEVNELADNLSGKKLIGNQATESAFKKEAGNYGILHLAMHAFVNDKVPNLSHLVFAEEKDSTEDRFLYAYELYNMKLKADLAVLSACETGAGKLQLGEGVMSLSRAFKYAGVPNIVMSFWKADDFYTKNIMTHFYQNLKDGAGKHKALQAAKKAQIASAKDNKEAAHPFYWANFVLVGNGEPVQFGRNNWMGWLACGFLLVLLGGIWFRR